MIYQFSSISLNTVSKQLRINGNNVDAEERIICLLMELISQYPQHCSKSHLLEAIWTETVVSDWSVSKLVSDTRHLFKQHGYEQEIIQTLHGRGYRLVPELGDQIPDEHTRTEPDNQPPPKPRLKRFTLALILAVVASLILAGLAVFDHENQLIVSEPPASLGRLLWVDDNPQNNATEKAFFEQHNITVYQVKSTEEALTSLALYDYNLVISDMGRQGEVLAGLNLLKSMRELENKTPFVLYTIVLTEAQQQIVGKYNGQGVAVESQKLYELVLPYYPKNSD